jgi:hypothetical protein
MMCVKLITGVHDVYQCQLEYINIVEMCVVNRRLCQQQQHQQSLCSQKYMLTLPGQLPYLATKRKDVFSTNLGIRLSFVKTLGFQGVGVSEPPTLSTPLVHITLWLVRMNTCNGNAIMCSVFYFLGNASSLCLNILVNRTNVNQV